MLYYYIYLLILIILKYEYITHNEIIYTFRCYDTYQLWSMIDDIL